MRDDNFMKLKKYQQTLKILKTAETITGEEYRKHLQELMDGDEE